LHKDDCTMVIFGGTGDLARRKLMPALYNMQLEDKLPDKFSVIGVGRKEHNTAGYRELLSAAVAEFSTQTWDPDAWHSFATRIQYISSDVEDPASFQVIKTFIQDHTNQKEAVHNYLYYLAVGPHLFLPIAKNFSGPMSEGELEGWRRIMIEKPFGQDLATARDLNKAFCASFSDRNIYRVDHYLGKEMLQNIMVVRFVNTVFEPLWNKDYIDNVQITVAENDGIGIRGDYYDRTGAMRDMVQSHLLQMLAVTAMEPLRSIDEERIVSSKVNLIRALTPWPGDKIDTTMVLGQYRGYLEEKDVATDSSTETYSALKLAVNTPRWQGVPFYLRTGKKLEEKQARVTIQFKEPLSNDVNLILNTLSLEKNRLLNLLVIKVQPQEGLAFQFNIKKPGSAIEIVPAEMDFCQPCAFLINSPEAYECLIEDAIQGDKSRFSSWNEIESSWTLIDELFKSYKAGSGKLNLYEPASWGPRQADSILSGGKVRWWS